MENTIENALDYYKNHIGLKPFINDNVPLLAKMLFEYASQIAAPLIIFPDEVELNKINAIVNPRWGDKEQEYQTDYCRIKCGDAMVLLINEIKRLNGSNDRGVHPSTSDDKEV